MYVTYSDLIQLLMFLVNFGMLMVNIAILIQNQNKKK